MEELNTTEEVLALGACIGRNQALNLDRQPLFGRRCRNPERHPRQQALPGTGPVLGGTLSTPGHQPLLCRSDPRRNPYELRSSEFRLGPMPPESGFTRCGAEHPPARTPGQHGLPGRAGYSCGSPDYCTGARYTQKSNVSTARAGGRRRALRKCCCNCR